MSVTKYDYSGSKQGLHVIPVEIGILGFHRLYLMTNCFDLTTTTIGQRHNSS